MEGRRRCLGLKTVLAVLGIISGASIFITFGYYRNVNAAVWGLLAAIFAAIVLRLHISHRRNVLHLRFTTESLRLIKLCGLVCSIITITAAVVYFILAAVFKQGYKLVDDGYAPAGIFALISLKWTIMMFIEGRWYEKFLQSSGGDEEHNSISNGHPYRKYDSDSAPEPLNG